LWDRLASSRWVALATSLKSVQGSPQIQEFLTQWRTNPQAQQFKQIANGLLGEELVVVGAAGTGEAIGSLLDALQDMQAAIGKMALMARASAVPGEGPPTGAQSQATLLSAQLIPTLVMADVPPVYLASRAGAIRE